MPTGEGKYWISCAITEEERDKLFHIAHENDMTVSEATATAIRIFIGDLKIDYNVSEDGGE